MEMLPKWDEMVIVFFINLLVTIVTPLLLSLSFFLSFGAGDDGSVRALGFSGGRETEASSTGKKHTLCHIKN